MRHNKLWMLLAPMRPQAMMLASITTLMLLLTGCASRPIVHEIDSNRAVVTVHKGEPFTPSCDGKFVPEARFDEMLDVYIRHSFEK